MKRVVLLIMSIMLLSSLVAGGLGVSAGSEKNLALGKTYTIESGAANEYSFGHTEQGSKDQLTDGVIGDPTEHYGGDWSHFVRGVSRTITIDLEKIVAIKSIETAFIQRTDFGIYCPQEVVFSISEDGENYMTVSAVENSVDNTVDTPTRVPYKAVAEKKYKARYVRVYFDVQVNSFIDEVFVFGTESTNDAFEIEPDEVEEDSFYYEDGKDIGVKDIICFHYGYWPDDETMVNNEKDVFKSYISYIDKNGKSIDTMFDAVMFLIIQGNCPSSGKLSANGGPTIMSDWEYIIENTFGENINLDALDQATAEMKETLELPEEHKTAVYLSVPHPKVSDIVFGDYDGDGIDNKILSLEDCVSVYTWYVDEVLQRYNQKNYENLDLKGFFWSSESLLSEYYEQEPELAKLCVDELHKREMQCIFIPYYHATGIEISKEIGFDATIMQANLMFKEALQKNPSKMMEDFAETAGKYHTGIQMEMHDAFIYDTDKYAPLFKQYLVSATESGLMKDAVHAYYQGAGYGAFDNCARSSDPFVRWFYDAIYKFIKGTLSLPEFKVNTTKEVETVANKAFIGTFDVDGDWNNAEFNLAVSKQPKHGTLFVNHTDGEYYYRAQKRYSGDDKFTLKYDDPNGKVVEVEVNVTVLEDTSASTSEKEDSSDESVPGGKSKNNIGLILGISGAAVAAGCAALIIFRKRKK